MQRKFSYLTLALAIGLIIVTGCYRSSDRYKEKPRDVRYGNERDERESFDKFPKASTDIPDPKRAKKLPWESWTEGRDLGGQPIRDSVVLKGDAYVNEGLRLRALQEYRKVNLNKVSAETRAAIVYRIASMQLASDKPQSALATLGAFFEKSKAKVEDVDPRFSLLFAYAYGRSGDLDQAFAWFSRVNFVAAGNGGLHDSAEQGARMLARTIADEDYQTVVTRFSADNFIHTVLGQESRRRSKGGIKIAKNAAVPFWLSPEVDVVTTGDQPATGRDTVVVMLPLSGRYAALGRATKNGIEMAFEGAGVDSVSVVYKDTAGDRVQAAAIVQEVSFYEKPPILIGPLLSSTASVVADTARQKNIPVLTLTKSTDFIVGDDVFRLGPTVSSQVSTLMTAVVDQKGKQKIAFVYPNDPQSMAFVDFAREELLDRGLQPAYDISYVKGDVTAFSRISQQLATQDIDAVFFPDDIGAATKFRFQLPEQLRNRLLLVGTARWNSPDELRRSRKAMEGVLFVSPFFQFSENPFVKQFQNTYKAKFGSEADFLAAQGFDAATLVLAAIKRKQESGLGFARAIGSIDIYQGLTGDMKVLQSGEVQRRFVVVELKPSGLRKLSEKKVTTNTRGQYDFRQ